MKKLIAMLLALVMVFALCACGGQTAGTPAGTNGDGTSEDGKPADDSAKLVGKWVADIDLADMILANGMINEDVMDDEMIDVIMPEDIELRIVMEFSDDGEVEVSVDGEDAVKEWKEQICENMVEYLRKELEATGATEEEFEEEYGMTLEEYVEESVITEMDIDDDELNVSEKDDYKLVGDKLYVGDEEEYFTVELDDEELTFEDYSDDWGDAAYLKDVTFKLK